MQTTAAQIHTFEKGDGVWAYRAGAVWRCPREEGERKIFGKVTAVHDDTYDVLIDGQVEHDIPAAACFPAPLCPECGEEPASGGGRGFECRGRSML